MPDQLTYLGKSLIHHGPVSNRIFLLKLEPDDLPALFEEMLELAREKGYGKIIAKVPSAFEEEFLTQGFHREAHVPGFYGIPGYEGCRDTACFMTFFLDMDRLADSGEADNRSIREKALEVAASGQKENNELPEGLCCREASAADVPDMANLYKTVFASYPFPIQDPAYLLKTMGADVHYFGIWEGTKLIALSSIEASVKDGNAEMTDFATLESYRGRGLASHLLAAMDAALPKLGIRAAYTIARACSPGMNLTFAGQGYQFGGTLVNNTHIGGQLESMNVWYKSID